MPISNRCSAIAGQIGKFVDRTMQQEKELQPTQRVGKETDGGFWRDHQGRLMTNHGPDYPALDTKERISVIGKLAGLGESGNKYATDIERFQNLVDIHHSHDMIPIREATRGFKKEEWVQTFEVLEQRTHEMNEHGRYIHAPGSKNIQPANERIALAAQRIKEYFDWTAKLAEKENVEGFARLDNYAPIMHETNTLRNEKFRQKAIQGIANDFSKREGHANVTPDDMARAKLVFDEYVGGQFAKVNANLQRQRVFDFGEARIMDETAISNYSKQFWHTLQEKYIFGERKTMSAFPGRAIGLADEIVAQNPGNQGVRVLVDAITQDTFGIRPSDPIMHSEIVRGLGALQALKMTMSVIGNATQSVNSIMATNLKSAAKAIESLAHNRDIFPGIGAREFRAMLGSVMEDANRQATLWQGGADMIGRIGTNVLKYTGFTSIEKYNRSLAGLMGAFYAQQQVEGLVSTGAKRYAERLIELGINPERVMASKGVLALDDMLIAGQKVINATQFRSRLTDLPAFTTQSPDLFRALLQFKTFGINQTKLMVDQGLRRPVRTAMFGLAVMPFTGMMVDMARDTVKEDVFGAPRAPYKDQQSGLQSYLESASAAGSFGILSDLANSMAMDDSTAIKNVLLPPIGASVGDYLLATSQLAKGNFAGLGGNLGRQFGGLGAAFVHGPLGVDDWAKNWEEL